MRTVRLAVALVAAAVAANAGAAAGSGDRALLTYTVATMYVRGGGIPLGLCATDLRGTPFRITDPGPDSGPEWSPDGRSLAFIGPADPPGQDHVRDLLVTDANGLNPRDLTRNGGRGGPSIFGWSPDSTAVGGNWGGLGTSVFIAKADGTWSRTLAYTNYGSYVFGESWSPDGKRILLERSSLSEPSAISVIDVDGTNERKLLDSASGAAWSPSGQQFAYMAVTHGRATGLGVADADGSNAHLLLQGESFGMPPTWSPDGSRLAFVEADGSLRVVRADGGGARVLASSGVTGTPQWSPDGSLIAFTRGPYRAPRVAVVKPDGTDEREIAAGSNPAWRAPAPLPSDRRPCIVHGTSRADVIHGTAKGDVILAGRGDDRVYGGGGADVIVGGLGHDRLFGGAGNDRFDARDRLRDYVFGGPGIDRAFHDPVDVLSSIKY